MRSSRVLTTGLALATLACGSTQSPNEPSTTAASSTASKAEVRLVAKCANVPKHDLVRGTAEHQGADPPYPVIRVRIDARNDASGTGAKGFLVVQGAPPIAPYRGRVTCLSVNGNEATIGIEIVKSTDPSLVGQGQLWKVVDGTPDQIAGYPTTPTAPTECPALPFSVPTVSGDYVVTDATP